MQANPPRADAAAASSEIKAAWALRLRVVSMAMRIWTRMVNEGLPPFAVLTPGAADAGRGCG